MRRKPTRFDWLVYRLFVWRWNPIFRDNQELRDFFRREYDDWEFDWSVREEKSDGL